MCIVTIKEYVNYPQIIDSKVSHFDPQMTQIQLPHLIREKIKDYLSFTEWRDKMSQVCIEYERKYEYYEYTPSLCCNIGYLKNYNYRYLNAINYREVLDDGFVKNKRFIPRALLSPNY